MALSRYSHPDDYTNEELRRKFSAATTQGRIAILKWLYRDHGRPPYIIAHMAIEESDPQVQLWIAKNGYSLDYREIDSEKYNTETKFENDLISKNMEEYRAYQKSHTPSYYLFPERDMRACLENSRDPFIRAAVKENPHFTDHGVFDESWIQEFITAMQIERLALVRNPRIHEELIEALFDYEDTKLTINIEERKTLIIAYLSNPKVLMEYSDFSKDAYWKFHNEFADFVEPFDSDSIWIDNKEHCATLWRLALNWPIESRIPIDVYQHLGAADECKSEIYKKTEEPALHLSILKGCTSSDVQTLALGLADENERCRSEAESKNTKAQEKPKRQWNIVKLVSRYLGTVVYNLIKLAIYLLILGRSSSAFETIVFVLMIFIYEVLSAMYGDYAITTLRVGIALDRAFSRIRELLKEKVSQEDQEDQEEETKSLAEKLKVQTNQHLIASIGFLFAVGVCLWKLIQAIW
jgi:hypothetical protein